MYDAGMRLLSLTVWTVVCVGLGIGLSTLEVSGRTPVQHAQRLLKADGQKALTEVKESATDLVDDVKKKVVAVKDRPLDRHLPEDRDALDKLILKSRDHDRK